MNQDGNTVPVSHFAQIAHERSDSSVSEDARNVFHSGNVDNGVLAMAGSCNDPTLEEEQQNDPMFLRQCPNIPDLVGTMHPATIPMMEATDEAIAAAALAVQNSSARLRLSPSPLSTANSSPMHDNSESTRKRSSPGTTTARQNKGSMKKAKGAQRIAPGGRVKVTRKNLWPIVTEESQKDVLKNFNDNYNFYGTVIGGGGNKGWKVEFNLFPTNSKVVLLQRKRIHLVADGEEEVPYDKATDITKYLEVDAPRKKKPLTPLQQSDADFAALLVDDRKVISEFEMKYNKDGDAITWKILKDREYLMAADDPCKYPPGVHIVKDLDFVDKPMSETFFCDFFPSVEGHAKKLDEFYSDIKAPFHQTVLRDGIKFNRPNDPDPDWIVKNCYLLVLAAVGEVKLGVDNLWKKGPSVGRKDYPDFGRYVPVHYFKAWQAAAPMMWCDEKYWYEDRRNMDWGVFVPIVKAYNGKRSAMMKTVLLMLDESMSGWRPKTSKLGGLPNITFEPRKPVPLGTQLRNGVECYTGCLVFQDIVQNPEEQQRKEYFYADVDNQIPRLSHLPLRKPIAAHVAEVMRQVKGANVAQGGWVGGDAWFGSVMTCVELMKEFGVYSTFIVKGNTLYFPMAALHSVLSARHGNRPAGHWVTMTATIADVNVIAIAYAWSQKGVSYFVSTCGDTEPSVLKYQSKFEDEWGNTMTREIDRPNICHFLYQYLPLIDEHNKQRQSLLQLERRWLTKDPWFRLLTTLVGMATVDMHRVYRYYEIKEMGKTYEEVDSLRVIEFSDQIAGGLRAWPYKMQRKAPLGDRQQLDPLSRIINKDGETHRALTDRERLKGKTVGAPVVLTCYICRRYLKSGRNLQQQTSFWCRKCHMPLCKVDRSDSGKRTMSCLQEHIETDDPDLACGQLHYKSKACPQRLWIDLDPRRSNRK
jgi:Transposase IS4